MMRVTLAVACWAACVTLIPPARAAAETLPASRWADAPPRLVPPPRVAAGGWARNAIDLFVLERLESEKVGPSADADIATLARRASLDLIGLPPGPEQVLALQSSPGEPAYERFVDGLLASPRFGERWAAWWLDLARYADTNGYEADYERPIWPYRDWVIRAFNAGMPFDRFSIEQLAGDLLPDATDAERVATGFHRNTLINTEDGTKEDEFRDAAIKDRVNTTFTVWMGSTIECAQCHDHKYDPVSQLEYYQLYAFFNNTTDQATKISGVWESDLLPVFHGDPGELARLREERSRARAAYETRTPAMDEAIDAWIAATRRELGKGRLAWRQLAPASARAESRSRLRTLDDASVLAVGPNEPRETLELGFKPGAGILRSLQIEVLPRPGWTDAARGAGGAFAVRTVEVKVKLAGDPQPRVLDLAAAVSDRQDGGATPSSAIDGKDETAWTVAGGSGRLVVRLAGPLDPGVDGTLTLRVGLGADAAPHGVHRLRLSASDRDDLPPGDGVPDKVRAALAAVEARAGSVDASLLELARAIAPGLEHARKALHDGIDALDTYESSHTARTMVLREGEPRPTRFLDRGSFLDPRQEVTPDVPRAHGLPLVAAGGRANRLDLARWLLDPRNPRTARVTVNRVWSLLFGRGLVATGEDFGVQGELPSHPELLDWLALELVSREWDLKALLRAIVTSSTYRQSSAATPEDLTRDAYNRLLGRGPRFRIEAEAVRDVALSAAGLLSTRVGGPSVFPPQPDSVFDNVFLHGPLARWPTSQNEDRFRRGLYTFIKRIAPHPMLRAFDAPNRSVCTVARGRSNTPLMALTTLNDPAFVEAAAGLARRMVEHATSPAARIEHGFLRAAGRAPRPAELAALLAALADFEAAYAADTAAAAEAVKGATTALGARTGAEAPAAWIVLANVLLNMDATLTRS